MMVHQYKSAQSVALDSPSRHHRTLATSLSNSAHIRALLMTLTLSLVITGLTSHSFAQSGSATTSDDIGAIPIIIRPESHGRAQLALAVPDAQNLGTADPTQLAANISRNLRRNLELAGYFQILTPATYFFDQHSDGMTEATINFQNWSNVGSNGLVKTAFRVAANQVRLDFRLFNVDTGSQVPLAFEPLTVGFDQVTEQVNLFSNQVVEYYSGARGPIGSAIAFVGRGEGGSREIYTTIIGSDSIRPITNNSYINILPRWAGRRLAYTTYIHGNVDLVMTTDVDGEHRIVSNRPGINMGGDISPDGTKMLVVLSMDGNAEIYSIDPNSGEIIARLTNEPAEDVNPIWSPNGRQIAFVSDRSGRPQIYVMNADGSNQRRVTFAGNYNTTPDWAPCGTRIAFTGRDSRNRFDIFVVDVASSHIERLTQDQGHNQYPSWSADGQYLVFQSTRGSALPRLYIMTADGNHQTLLTRSGSGYEMPTWRR